MKAFQQFVQGYFIFIFLVYYTHKIQTEEKGQ